MLNAVFSLYQNSSTHNKTEIRQNLYNKTLSGFVKSSPCDTVSFGAKTSKYGELAGSFYALTKRFNSNKQVPIFVMANKTKHSSSRYTAVDASKKMAGFISIVEKPEELNITFIKSFRKDSLKNIGTSLMQIAIEKALDKNIKQIKLTSIPSENNDTPHLFYKKLGFIPEDQIIEFNGRKRQFKSEELEKLLENNFYSLKSVSIRMMLSLDSLPQWFLKLSKQKILL